MHKYLDILIVYFILRGEIVYLEPEYILSAVKGLDNDGIISSEAPFILSQVTVPK